MRIGFGYDIHRLEEGTPLILGGVTIPGAARGPVAHSDGDVLLHAICDALLGAAALNDIGHHFPDDDPTFLGADSAILTRRTMTLLADRNLTPHNVDCTIVLERPKLAPHRETIRKRIAELLNLPLTNTSVKATTNETLGPIGAGEGIAAYAVVTVREKEGR